MFTLRPKSRACGSCKRCCEGWLTGEAYGSKFFPGQPCKFLGASGSNIYPNRPYDPCQVFECSWKRNYNWPDWLRPEQSNVIFIQRSYEDEKYMRGFSTKKPAASQVFEWAENWANETSNTIVVPRECIGFRLPLNGQKYAISVYGPNKKIRDYYASMYNLV